MVSGREVTLSDLGHTPVPVSAGRHSINLNPRDSPTLTDRVDQGRYVEVHYVSSLDSVSSDPLREFVGVSFSLTFSLGPSIRETGHGNRWCEVSKGGFLYEPRSRPQLSGSPQPLRPRPQGESPKPTEELT